MGRSRPRKDRGGFRPGIRRTHVDNTHRLDARFRWLDTEQGRGLSTLNAAPELPLGRDDEVLVKRVGMSGYLDPLAAAGTTESTAVLAARTLRRFISPIQAASDLGPTVFVDQIDSGSVEISLSGRRVGKWHRSLQLLPHGESSLGLIGAPVDGRYSRGARLFESLRVSGR